MSSSPIGTKFDQKLGDLANPTVYDSKMFDFLYRERFFFPLN
jgi:hypothetical protein